MRSTFLLVALLVGCASPAEDDTASNASGTLADAGFPNGGSGGGAAGAHAMGGSAGVAESCAHPPVNSPTADDGDLPPGPVVKYTVGVYSLKRGPNDEIIQDRVRLDAEERRQRALPVGIGSRVHHLRQLLVRATGNRQSFPLADAGERARRAHGVRNHRWKSPRTK